MLKITLGPYEAYDNVNNEFVTYPEKEYVFNFNLVALDKWESKHRKRLLDNEDITQKEYLDFFACMCESEDLNVNLLTSSEYDAIRRYMDDAPTATVIPNKKKKAGDRKTIFTSEIIYGYMSILNIPYEWETKNLNKLIVLINTISSLQSPPEKMTREESMEEHRRLILERRKQQGVQNDNIRTSRHQRYEMGQKKILR